MGDSLKRVLVVDDAQVMRRAVEKMLHGEHHVVLANDGEEGWERLCSDEQIDLLITDIQMPRLDGYGLICRVRADSNPRLRSLPIVTITGAEDDETRIRAYACGSTDFIIKPFDRKLLVSRVQAYLRLKEASLLQAQTSGSARGQDRDVTTQLQGLGSFIESGKALFQKARESGQDLSLAAFDIDDFGALGRKYGPTFVGQALRHAAKALTSAVRREDIAARVGESEFAVLVPQADRVQAMKMCERLRESMASAPLPTSSGPVTITASIGLVTLSADAVETFEKFLVLVEQRLSQARSDGGNRVGVTLLADVMPEAEEVVLSGAPAAETVTENDAGEIDLSVESGDLAGDLSVDELEMLVREEVARQRAANSRLRQ